MKEYFATADIHSFYQPWMESLNRNGFEIDNPDHIIIVCGDLFDRGEDSQKVYNFTMKMINEGRLIYVRGNHEDLMFDLLRSMRVHGPISYHHFANGTVQTAADLMGISTYDILDDIYSTQSLTEIEDKINQLVTKHSVDYFELPNAVFVHGWVPTQADPETQEEIVHPNWRDGGWAEARWTNGMEMWGYNICPEKTVVCGHWNTSYAHCKFRKACEDEYGPTAIFLPFIDNGIVALDACTAHTNLVNCVVFDADGNILRNI